MSNIIFSLHSKSFNDLFEVSEDHNNNEKIKTIIEFTNEYFSRDKIFLTDEQLDKWKVKIKLIRETYNNLTINTFYSLHDLRNKIDEEIMLRKETPQETDNRYLDRIRFLCDKCEEYIHKMLTQQKVVSEGGKFFKILSRTLQENQFQEVPFSKQVINDYFEFAQSVEWLRYIIHKCYSEKEIFSSQNAQNVICNFLELFTFVNENANSLKRMQQACSLFDKAFAAIKGYDDLVRNQNLLAPHLMEVK